MCGKECWLVFEYLDNCRRFLERVLVKLPSGVAYMLALTIAPNYVRHSGVILCVLACFWQHFTFHPSPRQCYSLYLCRAPAGLLTLDLKYDIVWKRVFLVDGNGTCSSCDIVCTVVKQTGSIIHDIWVSFLLLCSYLDALWWKMIKLSWNILENKSYTPRPGATFSLLIYQFHQRLIQGSPKRLVPSPENYQPSLVSAYQNRHIFFPISVPGFWVK